MNVVPLVVWQDVVKKFRAAGSAWACSVMLAQGAVLLNDSFDYPNGPLVTVSGGRWVHYSLSGLSIG